MSARIEFATVVQLDPEVSPIVSGRCLVDIGGNRTEVDVLPRITALVGGQSVILTYNGSKPYLTDITGTPDAPTIPNPPSPSPKPPVVSGTSTFTPIETRSYRSSGWRSDNTRIYQGEFGSNGNHTGCIFYGTQLRVLNGYTITAASIRMRRPANTGESYGNLSSTMRLMTNATRPAGAPTLTSSTTGPNIKAGVTTTFPVPASWIAAIAAGTAGGLAFFESDGDPYFYFDGKSEWSSACALTVLWQRN